MLLLLHDHHRNKNILVLHSSQWANILERPTALCENVAEVLKVSANLIKRQSIIEMK